MENDSEKRISFTSTVYNKEESNKVVNRKFQEFGQQATDDTPSVDKFFMDYEDLFFSIPILGATGSHQYLVEKSSELTKIESNETLSDVTPLIEEITQLRSQSVVDQQTIVDLNQQVANLNLIISQSDGQLWNSATITQQQQ